MKGRPGNSPTNVFIDPDPVVVARLVQSHGMDGASGRYFWLSREAVGKIAQRGREILRGREGLPLSPRGTRRSTDRAREDAAVATVLRLGSVHRATRETGLKHTLLMMLLRERGIPAPRLSREERSAAIAAGLARVNAPAPVAERTAA